MIRAHRELGAGASHGEAHPITNARKDMQALKQRLIDSELRAVEAKRDAAAEVAREQQAANVHRQASAECADIAAEAITQLGYTGSRDAQDFITRLRNAENRYQLPQHTRRVSGLWRRRRRRWRRLAAAAMAARLVAMAALPAVRAARRMAVPAVPAVRLAVATR